MMAFRLSRTDERLADRAALSRLCAIALIALGCFTVAARAHETRPAVADIWLFADRAEIEVLLSAEAILAGIDLSAVSDTNEAPQAADYDTLRALPADELARRLRVAWPDLAKGIHLRAGGGTATTGISAIEVTTPEAASLPRDTRVTLLADLPRDGSPVSFGWDGRFGPVILRQQGAGEDAYGAFLLPGQESIALPRTGPAREGAGAAFTRHVWLGFVHILPRGADHILFVLGIFFFSLRLRPLLTQVTAFTAAHTLTLALATLGLVAVPAAIVEPLIAASIAVVALENLFHRRIGPGRVAVVFCFGLLHGLGFAAVLSDLGLAPGRLVLGLVGFNIGVELGQLFVIAVGFLAVGLWFGNRPWYRDRIAVPASVGIAIMGLWWFVQRVAL